jgi:hypothetical protein
MGHGDNAPAGLGWRQLGLLLSRLQQEQHARKYSSRYNEKWCVSDRLHEQQKCASSSCNECHHVLPHTQLTHTLGTCQHTHNSCSGSCVNQHLRV